MAPHVQKLSKVASNDVESELNIFKSIGELGPRLRARLDEKKLDFVLFLNKNL